MSEHRALKLMFLLAICVAATMPAFSQGTPFEPNLANVAAGKDVKVLNRSVSATDKEGARRLTG
jgi:hypothetical protein